MPFLDYQPRGAARELFHRREEQVLVAGPAGTGKSRGCLERAHAICEKYPKCRGLIVRKTRASLTNTTLITYEQLVLPPGAARITQKSAYYPNGSQIDFGGLDKSSRIMSSEYDWAYVPEATELTEGDWEDITTRLRWGRVPYQQLFADCNPAQPTHWLKRRANAGKTLMLESRHEDNPTLWDEKKKEWTVKGKAYIAKLDALTGARYLRLRKGIWAAAEGLVYDTFDSALHLVNRFDIPRQWTRIWVIDFGYTNPFVWQAWAIDPDGRMYRYREIYFTQRIVEDHCRTIRELCKTENEPAPAAIICDHDAEDRATFERHMKMATVPAFKSVSPGIQAVQKRLRKAGDGRPRIMFLRDSLVERDPNLVDLRKPIGTEEEIEAYVWPTIKETRPEATAKDAPVKKDDHAMDAVRYAVAATDRIWDDPTQGPHELRIGQASEYRISSI